MSVFDEANSETRTPKAPPESFVTATQEGFDWPLDSWYIERILFLSSGAMSALGVFLFIVSFQMVFLLIPMIIGVMQAIFALTGFSIGVKVLLRFGFRQRS